MDIRSQEYRRSQKGSRLGQVARTVGLAVFTTLCFLNHANNKSKEAYVFIRNKNSLILDVLPLQPIWIIKFVALKSWNQD